MTAVSLAEKFDSNVWKNYSAYDQTISAQLGLQKHVNIRTFAGDSGEAWNTGTLILLGSGRLPALSISCTMGTTVTATSTTIPVDLLTGFANTDSISLALSNLPAGINQVTSAIRFVDHMGAGVSVNLSQSIRPLVAGTNCEFRVLRSAFSGIDLSGVVTVQLILVPTANCTFTALGLRLLASTWQYGAVDFDTVRDRLVRTIPLNSDITTPLQFTNTIFWKSDQPAGPNDPRPIDSTFSTLIYTGSQSGANSLTLYMRETPKAFLTQIDLDTMTQAQLDALGYQPDEGVSEYKGRVVEDLAGLTLSQLSGSTLFGLETEVDPVFTSWIQFQIQWGTTNGVSITNSANSMTYNYPNFQTTAGPLSLGNFHYYALIASVEESRVRFVIYDMDQTTFAILPTPVFDTLLIDDDSTFPSHPGRFGWAATLADGDASVNLISPTHLLFAEYRSAPFLSDTPVVGAQLFANSTPNIEYFDSFAPYPILSPSSLFVKDESDIDFIAGSGTVFSPTPSTPSLSFDPFGGGSTKVVIAGGGTAAYQGVITPPLSPLEIAEMGIRFDIFYPKASVLGGYPLQALLFYVSDLAPNPLLIPLTIPPLRGGQWETVVINPGAGSTPLPAGDWRLIIRASTSIPSTWYVRDPSIFERAVRWDARSVVDDPWEGNYAPWTPFHELINVNGGILFPVRGKALQMRGRALRQDAQIFGKPSLVPKYGQLGRLVWPEDKLNGVVPPVYSISSIVLGRFVVLSATQVSPGTGPRGTGTAPVALFEWAFGDQNSSLGQSVNHSYARAGTYTITLTVVDFYGNRTPVTTTVTCT